MMTPEMVRSFFAQLERDNPVPKTELEYGNAFQLLVAVILSAQSTDKGVNLVTKPLFEKISTPQQMMEFGEENLRQAICSIGLFRTKANNVIRMCEALMLQHRGEIPRHFKALKQLPGVGQKTANVILNTVFGRPTIAVDAHIFRLSNRTEMAPGKSAREVEQKLLQVVPKEYRHNAHHWLVLHGRYVCKARRPLCMDCKVYAHCGCKNKAHFAGRL